MPKLSICVTIKNRSRVILENNKPNDLDHMLLLFPNFVKSLSNALTINMDAELVIADWCSTDWPIKEWIEEYINISIHLITIQSDKFSIGRGRNIAAQHAIGDILFFVDADMIINKEIIDYAMSNVKDSKVYYPTVYYYFDKDHLRLHEGGGNLFITRNDFNKTNKWPEYKAHGFEDTDFYQELSKKYMILTHPTLLMTHQWHPQNKDFKNKYASIIGLEEIQERRDVYLNEQQSLMENVKRTLIAPNVTHHKLNKPQRTIL